MHSIGVDIGGSHITACIYDHHNKCIDKESLVYQKVNSKGSKEEIINTWVNAIDACKKTLDVKLAGIGIAMPGPFDYYYGISLIENVDKLSALYKVNVRLALAEKLKFTPSEIRFINDATAFSIAEARVGCAKDYRRVVGITLGTGLGASFLDCGKPIIQDNKVPRGGFLYNQIYNTKMADDLFSTRGILSRYKELTGKDIANVREICEQAIRDDRAKTTMEQFGEELGHFLKPYLIEFGAEALVIGGNIAKAYPYFGESLNQNLPDIKIEISKFGEQSAVIGSALLMDDNYYNNIKSTIKLM